MVGLDTGIRTVGDAVDGDDDRRRLNPAQQVQFTARLPERFAGQRQSAVEGSAAGRANTTIRFSRLERPRSRKGRDLQPAMRNDFRARGIHGAGDAANRHLSDLERFEASTAAPTVYVVVVVRGRSNEYRRVATITLVTRERRTRLPLREFTRPRLPPAASCRTFSWTRTIF